MKRYIICLLVAIAALGTGASAQVATPFIYPTPPDTMSTLQQRADYYVARFWDRCNFGSMFKNLPQLNRAFGDWLSLMPHASADTVHNAVDNLLGRFTKNGPETLALTRIAENWMWSDTAQFNSDEIYKPFLAATVKNKKISNADKAPFRRQLSIIENSAVGAVLPSFTFVRPDGTKGSFDEINKGSVLIFIDDPAEIDCALARTRLAANSNTRKLVEKGQLSVLVLNPGKADEEWKKTAAELPAGWHAGVTTEASDMFDLRNAPVFIYLDSNHKVLAKDLTLDHLLDAFAVVSSRMK